MSPTLKIVCPSCKRTLTIRNTPGVEQKTLTCPVCQFKAPVKTYINAALNVRVPSADAPTEIVTDRKTAASGSPAVLQAGGRVYRLAPGANTIGRKAQTGTATIQIEGDPYMSRLQGTLYVEKTGATYRYTYEEAHAANHTVIRGTELAEGDVIAIAPGDALLMGDTSVELCDAPGEECTQIK